MPSEVQSYPLVASPNEVVACSINNLFHSAIIDREKDAQTRIDALNRLWEFFVSNFTSYTADAFYFDKYSAGYALSRFTRDAFGVQNFHKWLEENEIEPNFKDELKEQVKNLGIRINSSSPRKTKIAAAFTLWMLTFRPLSLRAENSEIDQLQENLDLSGKEADSPFFLNSVWVWWVAQQYLKQSGEIILDDLPDCKIRMERILHDFTVRDVNLSSLELLYSSIFRKFSSK